MKINHQKTIIFFLIAATVALVFQSSAPPPPMMPMAFEREPPVVDKIWVKKLPVPTPAGETMIMKIKYKPDSRLQPSMYIYYGDADSVLFKDNGVAPDVSSGDLIYTAFIIENVSNFLSEISSLESTLATQGGVVHFDGHYGKIIDDEAVSFDAGAFDANQEVEVSTSFFDIGPCDEVLLKQNSLFITDLSVVEDAARTYNVINGGNKNGVYTFGNLIKNICNQPYTQITPKEFLKRWLQRWTDPSGTTINYENVPARTFAFHYLIGPWIQAAGGGSGPYYYASSSNVDDWEDYWDDCDEDELLENAPFKLMAIVNRIDLRGNAAYANQIINAGETRFIFTLIAPFQLEVPAMPVTAVGMPPKGADGSGLPDCEDLLDWEGMNLIIEYGNPFTNRCQLKAYAQAWTNLSGYTLGSTAYKDALEDILHTVIDANSNPARGNNNKSCLNQLRTNERIFFPSGCNFPNQDNWARSDWELSQFELSGGYLLPAPVTNTPRNISNSPIEDNVDFTPGPGVSGSTPLVMINTSTNGHAIPLIDWVYWKKVLVTNGNHNLPLSYTYGGNTVYLAGTARMDMEAHHFWDLNWPASSTTNYTYIPYNSTGREYDRNLRRQLSLNTCQGCHGAENKTLFTQVRPLGVGEQARYWLSTPDDDNRPVDATRFAENISGNKINFSQLGVEQYNYILGSGNQHFPRVSGFLTGRAYTGSGTWQDDLVDGGFDDGLDHLFDNPLSLYYVFEPNNCYQVGNGDNNWLLPEGIAGYNDLQRRKQHLCQFLNSNCNPVSVALSLGAAVSLVPLPVQGN